MVNIESRLVKTFLWFTLLAYLLVLIKLIIFKWPLPYVKEHFLQHYNWQLAKTKLRDLNLVPFHTIYVFLSPNEEDIHRTSNLLGNIAGFIPLGFLLPVLIKKLRTARATIFRVFLISLCFEVTQLLILLGYFDVDDLMLNTAGGALGYIIFSLLRKKLVRE